MDADTFVAKLEVCRPTHVSLLQGGMSASFAEKILRSLTLPRKPEPEEYEDPLLDLLGRYDASSVELGMVTFLASAKRIEAGWFVGEVEVDPVIVSHQDGSVYVEEYGTNGYVQWECARDSSSFLEAMCKVGCYLMHRPFEQVPDENQPANCAMAKECTIAAGGDRYRSFYEMLLGCD